MGLWAELAKWFKHVYLDGDGVPRLFIVEDLAILGGAIYGLFNLYMVKEVGEGEAFFDSGVTFTSVLVVVIVLTLYHFLWRAIESVPESTASGTRDRKKEQWARLVGTGLLLLGFHSVGSHFRLFILILVLFYTALVVWQLTLSGDDREARGTWRFDVFGLICAVVFAGIALYVSYGTEAAQQMANDFPVDFPNRAVAVQSIIDGLAVKRPIFVHLLGLFAGAMAANAVLAFLRVVKRG